MLSIVLIEPEYPSNIGAIARAMANFDFNDLVLIHPKCNHLDKEAILRAKHSSFKILKNAKIRDFSYLNSFDYLVGTTSRIGTDYNIPRSPINIERFLKILNKINNKKAKIALLFGRDGAGLNNREIQKCDFIVSIPTSPKYAALNISHAAAILLYEIFKNSKNSKIGENIAFANKKDKDVVLNYVCRALDKMSFQTKTKKETQKKIWKRVIGKSMLTRREAFALCGFFKKI